MVVNTEVQSGSCVKLQYFRRLIIDFLLSGYLKIIIIKKKKMGFTACKAEQPLRGMDLQQKEAQKD